MVIVVPRRRPLDSAIDALLWLRDRGPPVFPIGMGDIVA
jgi:hypothetical protein